LETVTGSEQLHRVTSDAKAWPPGSLIAHCRDCRLVQTVTTPEWSADIRRIYESYTIYHQGGGTEQSVFKQQDGQGSLRSDVIIQALQSHYPLPAKGRLLDIGCGNGSFLQACSRALPTWDLQGTEFDDKYKEMVEAIPSVSFMHGGKLEDVPGTFDVISLIHVLEHIPNPLPVLKSILPRLAPNGLLFIEVPNSRRNPVMMLVADHCSHFSDASLGNMVQTAGFNLSEVSTEWVPRELSLVAQATEKPTAGAPDQNPQQLLAGLDWLQQTYEQVQELSAQGPFGIFGTSIAATCLESQIGNKANFFVDEDPARIGKEHLGKPIVAPADIANGSLVYIALPHPLAGKIAERLNSLDKKLRITVPPERS
jgi:2-polyprenyl-3-methyl-5-hydroxy-6-metoxy-1,4-benzoquinol methylase